jgi:hypothetical protein
MIKSGAVQRLIRLGMRVALGIEAFQRVPRSFLSGLAISYPPAPRRGGTRHKLAGKRAPDVTVAGTRLAEALRTGRFVLIDSTASGDAAHVARERYEDKVTTLTGRPEGRGATTLPAVTLVRPDSYIAWATDSPSDVDTALAEWCGRVPER